MYILHIYAWGWNTSLAQGRTAWWWAWRSLVLAKFEEQLPHVWWFQGGLEFKAHRLLYHSTLGSRVIKKRRAWKTSVTQGRTAWWWAWRCSPRPRSDPPTPRGAPRSVPISHNVFIKWFNKVNLPARSSTCCWNLLIKTISWRFCGVLTPFNWYIVWDESSYESDFHQSLFAAAAIRSANAEGGAQVRHHLTDCTN